MTPKECAEKLIKYQNTKDVEQVHVEVDGALCDLLTYLGYEDVVDEYRRIRKNYG